MTADDDSRIKLIVEYKFFTMVELHCLETHGGDCLLGKLKALLVVLKGGDVDSYFNEMGEKEKAKIRDEMARYEYACYYGYHDYDRFRSCNKRMGSVAGIE